MHPRTRSLKTAVSACNDLFDKLSILRDAYAGETAYLAVCGPSLTSYDPARLRSFLADRLVLSVKQAFNVLSSESDFHLLVPANAQRYRYGELRPIVVDEHSPSDPPCFSQPDILFPKEPYTLFDAISVTKRHDDYVMAENPARPCGPGTLYELGFYLALHLGVRRIVVIGWDMHSDPEQLSQLATGGVGCTHFYEPDQTAYRRIDEASNPAQGFHRLFERYRDGFLINTAPFTPADDVLMTAIGSAYFFEWLRGRDVDLFVCCDSPNVSRCIPRVDLFETRSPEYLAKVLDESARLDFSFPHLEGMFLTETIIHADAGCFGRGWHGCEGNPDASVTWRWSGPDAASSLFPKLNRGTALELVLTYWKSSASTTMTVLVNDERCEPDITELPTHSVARFRLRRLPAGNHLEFTHLQFIVNKTNVPAGGADPRRIGIAFVTLQVRRCV